MGNIWKCVYTHPEIGSSFLNKRTYRFENEIDINELLKCTNHLLNTTMYIVPRCGGERGYLGSRMDAIILNMLIQYAEKR